MNYYNHNYHKFRQSIITLTNSHTHTLTHIHTHFYTHKYTHKHIHSNRFTLSCIYRVLHIKANFILLHLISIKSTDNCIRVGYRVHQVPHKAKMFYDLNKAFTVDNLNYENNLTFGIFCVKDTKQKF